MFEEISVVRAVALNERNTVTERSGVFKFLLAHFQTKSMLPPYTPNTIQSIHKPSLNFSESWIYDQDYSKAGKS